MPTHRHNDMTLHEPHSDPPWHNAQILMARASRIQKECIDLLAVSKQTRPVVGAFGTLAQGLTIKGAPNNTLLYIQYKL